MILGLTLPWVVPLSGVPEGYFDNSQRVLYGKTKTPIKGVLILYVYPEGRYARLDGEAGYLTSLTLLQNPNKNEYFLLERLMEIAIEMQKYCRKI